MPIAQISTANNHESQQAFPVLRAWNLPHLVHGFTTRKGGMSRGFYHSFNLAEGVGDDPKALSANWARWQAAYPLIRLARLQQVHSNLVHQVGFDYEGERKIGDGMVTEVPGIVLAIFTADCVPLLMVDAETRIVSALHAGWRGTLANIVGEGVHRMAALGARADRVHAALGPAIGSCCFEVDAELADHFVSRIPGSGACCSPGRPGKKHLDLRGIVRLQLEEAGLARPAILDIGPCTRCNSDRMQMSFIGFEPEQ
jgi:YfiH family protein